MKLPGFTAEASLFTTAGAYLSQGNSLDLNGSCISPAFYSLSLDFTDGCTDCMRRCMLRGLGSLCVHICYLPCHMLQNEIV